ncbi:MAG TPA: crotonase/enoyl-CoA hydratase family protein [Candidatus Competibacteraceae bacterium]|nr:MAG: crotonase/enoyl-CoA hydratase family protein [Candidatus Competibacteraceae bacterium]HOB63278.1 crotonase/enoyl-CoA hydratase family protein [Candidatus Competibacteraceae bacterium]HQA25090.1 crotonase/enoyl-CoA hydratase family protein [Candidatus Competibacteraceae bacterium]HQD57745.1 crotonase/enoyl-CoA hydratase family protein [Candidatus Competibacteraceae bacterium]
MSELTCLNFTLDHQIAWIELDRPSKANALNGTLWQEIGEVFRHVDELPEARVVVLSGAGRHFCAGIDFELVGEILDTVGKLSPGRREEHLRHTILGLQAAFTALERCRKPVLAAIQGLCIGGGLDLIAACDMRYATADAAFSLKEADLAIVADIGSLQRLPYLIGEGRLRELAFTTRQFGAAEAQTMGLVNQVFPDAAQLWDGVGAIAAGIAAKSPLTVRGVKQVLNYSRDHSVADGLDYVATWNAAMLLSDDTREAVAATLAKRHPRFED